REVRDALAYLRILVNPDDQVSVRRVLNTPKRGIGDRAEACVAAFADRERVTFWQALQRAGEIPGLVARSRNSIAGFVETITEVQQMVLADERADVVLEKVLDSSGYLQDLETRVAEHADPQDEVRLDNLAEPVA